MKQYNKYNKVEGNSAQYNSVHQYINYDAMYNVTVGPIIEFCLLKFIFIRKNKYPCRDTYNIWTGIKISIIVMYPFKETLFF